MGKKSYDEAISKFHKAVEIDPNYGDAYFNWGVLLMAQGRDREANEKLISAKELGSWR